MREDIEVRNDQTGRVRMLNEFLRNGDQVEKLSDCIYRVTTFYKGDAGPTSTLWREVKK